MALLVYLLRHGETVWNQENRTQGWTDIELNAQGVLQAAALGRALAAVPLDAVYASTLSRARATAAAIASLHGLNVTLDPDLRELNQGTLDGLTSEDLRRDHQALLKEWAAHAAHLRMPGGESMADLQERAWGAIGRIVETHPSGIVAVVSHNLTIVTILCRLLDLPLDRFRVLRQSVAALNLLEFGGIRGPAVVRVNDTSHLASASRFVGDFASLADSARFAPLPVAEADVAQIAAAAVASGLAQDDCHVLPLADADRQSQLRQAVGEPAFLPEPLPLVLALLSSSAKSLAAERLGAAVQSMRLAAHALGYRSTWLPPAVAGHPALPSALGVAPQWRVAALLAVGLAAGEEQGAPR